MLYMETTSLCSQVHKKHIHTMWCKNLEKLYVKTAVHILTNAKKNIKSK